MAKPSYEIEIFLPSGAPAAKLVDAATTLAEALVRARHHLDAAECDFDRAVAAAKKIGAALGRMGAATKPRKRGRGAVAARKGRGTGVG